MIRVGRCHYQNGKRIDPSYPNFTPIVVLTKSSQYGSLGPYVLKDGQGRILENIWQGSKVYEKVPYSCQRYSRWDQTIIWEWPEEQHLLRINENEFEILPAYFNWREKLMNNPYPVRYPVGYHHRRKVLLSLEDGSHEPLDYITARKRIYYPLYVRLVKGEKQFEELRERMRKGENLLIIDVDGPHQESLSYYKEKYNIEDSFIEKKTLLATKENLTIMLNDEKYSFGHGYCLAAALQDIDLN